MNGSLFAGLRADIDRMLCAFGLSHEDGKRTLPSDTHEGGHEGGHDEEPDQASQRELHDGDAEQRGEAPVSVVWSQERDEQAKRRVLSLDGVPVVRLAYDAAGDVGHDSRATGPLAGTGVGRTTRKGDTGAGFHPATRPTCSSEATS